MKIVVKAFCLALILSIFCNEKASARGFFSGIARAASGAVKNVGRRLGGSGKPMLHFVRLPNRSAAANAARSAGRGNTPIHHTAHQAGQLPHFHPADKFGNIIKDGSHFTYG